MPRVSDDVWMLFVVPCPVPGGRTARDLYQKRVTGITHEMRIDARARGCRFHRAWHAADCSRATSVWSLWGENGTRAALAALVTLP